MGHNLRIASILSFVAGIVNVGGFLAIRRLTTNVTGHFTFFVDEVFQLHLLPGLVYFLFIFFFFLGSFCSGMLIQVVARRRERLHYVAPVLVEGAILCIVGLLPQQAVADHPDTIAFSLLFAMGLQNSLVTTLSNAAVRTTHLTGLFTDLGIELSQLIFAGTDKGRKQLAGNIKLRLTILSFFFLGGVTTGVLYSVTGLRILIVATLLLLVSLVYDTLKFRVLQRKRKAKSMDAFH